MAQSVPLQPMPEFNTDAEVEASVATRWTTWLPDFEIFLLAGGITDTEHQRAVLLYNVRPRVREIFKQIPNNEDDNNFNTAKEKLTEYFSHKLTACMTFTGSAKPNRIKKSHWTNSTLAYEHLPKIGNFQKIIWNSK